MNKTIANKSKIQEIMNEVVQDIEYEDITDFQNTYKPINDFVTCDNCGNVWDGYAQCLCYGLYCYRKDNTTDTTDTTNAINAIDDTDTTDTKDTINTINTIDDDGNNLAQYLKENK